MYGVRHFMAVEKINYIMVENENKRRSVRFSQRKQNLAK